MTVFRPTPPSKPFRRGVATGAAVPLAAACQTVTGVATPDLSATPPAEATERAQRCAARAEDTGCDPGIPPTGKPGDRGQAC